MRILLLFLALLVWVPAASADVPVLVREAPIQGVGFLATGGAGKPVCSVTQMTDRAGTVGSLRDVLTGEAGSTCCTVSDGCTVTFTHSGYITLRSTIVTTVSNLTIDGSQAPGNGVALRGKALVLSGDNTIVRYMRFRAGVPISSDKSLAIAYFASMIGGNYPQIRRVWIDHNSMSWSGDTEFDIISDDPNKPVTGVTVSNNIFSEGMLVGGGLAGGNIGSLTFTRNLYASNADRNHDFCPGYTIASTPIVGRAVVEFFQNVIYNFVYGSEGCSLATGGRTGIDFYNNWYIKGPVNGGGACPGDCPERYPIVINSPNENGTTKFWLKDNAASWLPGVTQQAQLFADKNTAAPLGPTATGDSASYLSSDRVGTTPLPPSLSGPALEVLMLADVGATLPSRDAEDTLVIDDVILRRNASGGDAATGKHTNVPAESEFPPIGIGIACNNGIDDDGNGLKDFSGVNPIDPDPNCISAADISETEVCGDGQIGPNEACDDDNQTGGDGCGPTCAVESGYTCVGQPSVCTPTTVACNDGTDNDGDGLNNFPADPGCTSAADTTETNAAVACDDGLDNDSDGTIDELDAGCQGGTLALRLADTGERGTSAGSPSQCDDGVDNDSNGQTDFPADSGGCTGPTDTTEAPTGGTACNDTNDNDGDGLVDYPMDTGCTSLADTDETGAAAGVTVGTAIPAGAVTFTFPTNVSYGYFLTGDPWVVNTGTYKKQLSAISPAATATDNGWRIDPASGTEDWSEAMADCMVGPCGDQTITMTWPALPTTGTTIDAGAAGKPISVVKAISLTDALAVTANGAATSFDEAQCAYVDTSGSTVAGCLYQVQILTVLAAVPAADAIRPPFINTDAAHKVAFSLPTAAVTALPDYADRGVVSNDIPTIATANAMLKCPWVDPAGDVDSYYSQHSHPIDCWRGTWFGGTTNRPYDSYGTYAHDAYTQALSALMQNDAVNATKIRVAAMLVQYGVDLWAQVEAGQHWYANGGHSPGRKFPILFAGYMLANADMLALEAQHPGIFSEDIHTYTSGSEGLYGSPCIPGNAYGYTTAGNVFGATCNMSGPPKDCRADDLLRDGSEDEQVAGCQLNPTPATARLTPTVGHSGDYQYSPTSVGPDVVMAQVLGLRDEWAHDALFAYIWRMFNEEPWQSHGPPGNATLLGGGPFVRAHWPAQCNDGVDNDHDGFIDYPAEASAGCTSTSDPTE